MGEGIEAQRPGREVGAGELAYLCHRYWVAGQIAQGRRTLEVACGSGLGVAHLRRVAAYYVAGDLAAEHLVLVRRAAAGTPLLRLRAEALPVAAERFEVILALEVVQYVDTAVFLAEVRRALAADGLLFVTLPNCRRAGFAPSPFAREYLDSVAWQERCAAAGLHARVFGAFRQPGWLARARRSAWMLGLRVAAQTLNVLDPGRRLTGLRSGARRAVYHQPLRLPDVLADADLLRASGVPLELLGRTGQRLGGHSYLYLVAARSDAVVDRCCSRLTGLDPGEGGAAS
jgi:SAM-dependent methyltransferase